MLFDKVIVGFEVLCESFLLSFEASHNFISGSESVMKSLYFVVARIFASDTYVSVMRIRVVVGHKLFSDWGLDTR